MKFLDQAKVYIRSGNGGSGAVSFRREKFIEFGALMEGMEDGVVMSGLLLLMGLIR